MARSFNPASSEYLEIDSALGLSTPFTMAAFFNTDDDTISEGLLWVGASAMPRDYFALHCLPSENGLIAQTRNDPSGAWATTTSDYGTDQWHHACGVWASTASRAVYLDGGSKGTNNTNVADHTRR